MPSEDLSFLISSLESINTKMDKLIEHINETEKEQVKLNAYFELSIKQIQEDLDKLGDKIRGHDEKHNLENKEEKKEQKEMKAVKLRWIERITFDGVIRVITVLLIGYLTIKLGLK
jgi:septal ring factor EnvC (AmiA/AmiB activator)